MAFCKSVGCFARIEDGQDFCPECVERAAKRRGKTAPPLTMAEKYPVYYKPVGEMTEVDVYAVHHLFDIQDPSGAIHHASKKLLLAGVRNGGKSMSKDIKEARDTLNRWLELNQLE